jgi:hypothetical protein
VHLPWRRGVDAALRDVTRLPSDIVGPATEAVETLLSQRDVATDRAGDEPAVVRPGSLGLALHGAPA